MARNGKLDPTIGRYVEIRRTIQILFHRTKSNPVFEPSIIQPIGPPGVGKPAILEGLASQIVSKEVPESLHDKHVLSIDLAGIIAGSGIRGQFEKKFRDFNSSALPRVRRQFFFSRFTSTADEYRKTIGKAAALEHQFQPVQIAERTVESTISILHGLEPRYEVHHAAVYGARYVSDHFLPDKAIDLVDEAASSLRLAQESKPDRLEALDCAIVTLQIELESLKKESDTSSVERRSAVKPHERAQQRLEDAKHQLDVAQREGDFEKASRLRFSTIPELTEQLPDEKAQAGREEDEALWMLHERVTSNDISRVVAHATGIPFHDRHTISRLIGAAPGYAGFEEGGRCLFLVIWLWILKAS
ncbi:P-loop containing nucleoside triphosphate hydrolase protein [Mycena albidolilacea]|uniref:P-loop containing nucleoside triphosphate hydrolase protein n=1 Tax=Mycena albidolilacea TaxID=1033008 RepID=A0AAD7EI49_9AGAR|nr:P-loop containing nucleoside triphosphate hydrolase protein [Mycena albidolilacea]